MGNHTNALNTLEQIKRETKDDARLYACIRDLYEQGANKSLLFVRSGDNDRQTPSTVRR